MPENPVRAALRTFLCYFLLPGLGAATALLLVQQLAFSRVVPRADGFENLGRVAELIRSRYVEEVPPEQLLFDAIEGMARRDPYSDFVSPEHVARYREEQEGEYVGLGFMVHVASPPLTVLWSFPGSPAAQAGLQPGDRIVAVDGVPCTSRADAIARIKNAGDVDSALRLSVRRWRPAGAPPAEPVEVEVERRHIEKPSVVDARLLGAARGIAYVRVTAFQAHTAADLRHALEQLATAGMKALVLDLRQNPGGLLEQAVATVSLFVEDGLVVSTRGRAPSADVDYRVLEGEAPFRGLPLAVLVDGHSASAAEVVAGSLQDHLRAMLVGNRTYGKGVVQSVIEQPFLVDGRELPAVLKITTSRYHFPSGRTFGATGKGVTPPNGLVPDVVVPLPGADAAAQLARHFQDREIARDQWALLRERGLEYETAEDAGFVDRQLERAAALLAGAPAFSGPARGNEAG